MNTISLLTLIIALATSLSMVVCMFFNAKIKKVSLYWIISLIGATTLLCINHKNASQILGSLITDSSINPIKILVFFLSMVVLSIILDNLHFFEFVAQKCVKLAKNSQIKLFVIFYALVSILTIFTSNDIVILSFVPFICYFCKNCNINPIPFVFSTFVAANTWSMIFIIGNPTNVYISSFAGIDFGTYFLKMALPTIATGTISFFVLLILFYKQLKKEIIVQNLDEIKINKPLILLNSIILLVCTILLAISSYINLEMWYIALCFMTFSIIINLIVSHFIKHEKRYIWQTAKKAPWAFVPFLISMFIIVMCLDVNGFTKIFAEFLAGGNAGFVYGFSSFLASNVINNISMTTLFASILANGSYNILGIYATIIGSNLGAIFTPVGALAGIMFMNILKSKGINFPIWKFIVYGIIVSAIALPTAIGVLLLV